MALLIHHPICPFSRKIRLLMAEKKMLFVLKEEEPWNLSSDFIKINPAQSLPVFLTDGKAICGNYAITEFLESLKSYPCLFPENEWQKAEIRRLTEWFDQKFYKEVYVPLVIEKIYKRFAKGVAPDSKMLKIGLNNLNFHMEYIDWLTENRAFLAGDFFSLADICAAAHLSVLDYLGDVPWDNFKNAKLWYSKIKSRPTFKDILKDNIRGVLPSRNYTNLDF